MVPLALHPVASECATVRKREQPPQAPMSLREHIPNVNYVQSELQEMFIWEESPEPEIDQRHPLCLLCLT
jgi:hypothetical protein